MMHYTKGDNFQKETTKEELQQMFSDCMPKDHKEFLWMHVKGGTKVSNVVGYAKNAFDKGEHRCVIWSGHGGGVIKTVSCAEIFKRKFPLYQVTRACYTVVEEHWLPKTPGLDDIVVKRQIPTLHIYMSLDPIDPSVEGVQKPNEKKSSYWCQDREREVSKSGCIERYIKNEKIDRRNYNFDDEDDEEPKEDQKQNSKQKIKNKQNHKQKQKQRNEDFTDKTDNMNVNNEERNDQNKKKNFKRQKNWQRRQDHDENETTNEPCTSQQAQMIKPAKHKKPSQQNSLSKLVSNNERESKVKEQPSKEIRDDQESVSPMDL